MIPTGLFTRTKNMNSYDNWLNSTNPYDKDYELEEERAYHLDKIKDMDEEEIHDYLFFNRIEDPREEE
jgi:hypothetical protein